MLERFDTQSFQQPAHSWQVAGMLTKYGIQCVYKDSRFGANTIVWSIESLTSFITFPFEVCAGCGRCLLRGELHVLNDVPDLQGIAAGQRQL